MNFGILGLLSWLGLWRTQRQVDVFGKEIHFAWSCMNPAEAEATLAAAVAVLVDVLPSVGRGTAVRSLRFLNPQTGFAIDPSRLREITSDFGPQSARLLMGECVEFGTILVDGALRLENLQLDARSPLVGHFSVELPALPREVVRDTASQSGFQLGETIALT